MIELKIPFHIDANAFRGSNNGFASPGNSIIDFEGNNRDVSYSDNGGEKRRGRMVFACSTESNRKLEAGDYCIRWVTNIPDLSEDGLI